MPGGQLSTYQIINQGSEKQRLDFLTNIGVDLYNHNKRAIKAAIVDSEEGYVLAFGFYCISNCKEQSESGHRASD